MTDRPDPLLTREAFESKDQARQWLRDRAKALREAGDLEQAERLQAMADGSEEFERFQLTGSIERTQ